MQMNGAEYAMQSEFLVLRSLKYR